MWPSKHSLLRSMIGVFVLASLLILGDRAVPAAYAAAPAWHATSLTGAPTARGSFSTVWTGTEMIVWGGDGGSGPVKTGARYNPTTDTWVPMSTVNAPSPRRFHTAVWTGNEMFVWGGESGTGGPVLNTGGRYNPTTDTWTPITTANAPLGTYLLSSVWTGSQVIVWGGRASSIGITPANTGGVYDPATDTWAPTSAVNAPSARMQYTSVWSGTEMIVWGGTRDNNGAFAGLTTGGRYNPTTDTWTATSNVNAPAGGANHSAVWTGTEMIVWGGNRIDSSYTNTGGRYNPVTDTWVPTSTINAPTPRCFQLTVWTGTEMLIWGGNTSAVPDVNSEWVQLNTGGRYNPASDRWVGTSITDAPIPRSGANGGNEMRAIWTGSEMIVWGGDVGRFFLGTFYQVASGGRYAPANDTERPPTVPFPTISGLNLSSGPAGGGTSVTISGAYFTPDTTVILTPNAHNFGGGVGATVNSVASTGTTVTITTPPASGTMDLLVITDGGVAVLPGAFTYGPTSTPLVITTDATLPNGTIGAAYLTTLTAMGGTTPYTWGIASGSLPPGLNLDPSSGKISGTPTNGGTYTFTVQCAISGGQTATKDFTITINNPLPTLTSLDPNTAKAGGPAFTLTVNGTNFVTASTVQWNGTNRTTTYVSATQLTAAITAADIASGGTASVTVVNPAPNGGTSNALPFAIQSDTIPPKTTATPDRPANANGWYKASVAVTLSAVDNDGGSGVAKTEYNLDGTGWAVYSAPIAIANEAKHALQYRSTDNAGNVETPGSLPINLDVTAPTAVAGNLERPADSNGWYNHAVKVTFTGDGGLSGLDSCTSATYSGPDSATATATGTCTDKAGNVSASVPFTFKYDATPPTGVAGTPDRAANANGWYNAPVTVTFSGQDATSGIASCTTGSYSGPDRGSASVSGSCTDNAGNVANATFALKYDGTKPTVTYTGNAGTYAADQAVAITCAAADNLSGVASSTCQNISGPAYSFTIGANTFSATATDNAGNGGSGTVSFTVTVDATSLANLVNQFVTNTGVANSLTTKIAKGNMQPFINEVNAQTGKKLTAEQAAILIKLANAL